MNEKRNIKHKRKKQDDSKYSNKRKHSRRYSTSSSSSSSDSDRREDKRKELYRRHSSSSNSESDQWVEKVIEPKESNVNREDWMSMTGMLKTYTRNEIKPKEKIEKKHIDSYNPATCSRELNPYWKDGGTGLPQTPEEFRKSRKFIAPADDDDYYTKKSSQLNRPLKSYSSESSKTQSTYSRKSHNWKKDDNSKRQYESTDKTINKEPSIEEQNLQAPVTNYVTSSNVQQKDNCFLTDEQMNKLGAKIVKAEIMGNTKLVEELNAKLKAAREYRKLNPDAAKDDGIMLMATNSAGMSRPLTQSTVGDARSKGGKKKADTHAAKERIKYFAEDDKYNLKEMFENEKYGNNYDDEAQLAKVISKHKNLNDDLEDIFTDEISKNRSSAKDDETEKQRAIKQHVKMEKSLEGCEFCVDSKRMVKHLMVSCGSRVYLALPGKQSLVEEQCIITTIQHATCVTAVDEDVWEEIMNYRRILTQYFNSKGKDVVFFETAIRLDKYPHMVINCVPLPRDVGDVAAIYFKKALQESETEWSMNKKVVELKGKNIRKGIPKGLPYFWIDFAMDPGFAHVIEDQHLFPRTFAEQVIAGILDLDHNLWKNPRKEYGDLQRKKILDFTKQFKPFDTIAKK